MLDACELKRRCDFVVLVSRYTRLQRAGRQYVGLCPLHLERSPSFYVHPQKKIWKCFGCGAGGDLLAFLMRAEHCSFPRALQIVSDFSLGVARESEPQSGSRFRADEGAKPLSARSARSNSPTSQAERQRLIARLDATEVRLQAIRTANDAASAEVATACEPRRKAALLLVNKRITGRE
ncbi:MAG: CHC2 zinc finger domain-containing protein [Candidatus Acidiferrales bacterium]